MRIVLLFSLFVIWNSGPVGWRLLPENQGVPLFFCGYGAMLVVVAVWGRRWVRRLGGAGPVARPAGFFGFWKRPGTVCRSGSPPVFSCWDGGPYVDRMVGTSLLTPGTLIGLSPGLIAWAGLWWAAFPVERAVREMNAVYDVEAGLPVFAFPTLVQYLGNKFRGQLLFMVVPVVMVLAVRDLIAAVWTGLLRHTTFTDNAESVVTMTAVVLVMVISPAVLKYVLQTFPLPESPLRDKLASVSRSAGVGVRDILLWNTHHNTGNAAVMGLVRPVRYVMLSDLLIETLTDQQIQAVFAHELGHVRHRHLFWFVAFFIGVGGAIFRPSTGCSFLSTDRSSSKSRSNWCRPGSEWRSCW